MFDIILALLTRAQIIICLGAIWLVLAIYWVAAIIYERLTHRVKQIKKRTPAMYFWGPRFVIIAFVVISLLLLRSHNLFARIIPAPSIGAVLGIAIAAVGILFAIWARVHLGSNWSMQAMVKKRHKLVTTGPYAIVRNPIYSGIIAGFLGSFIAVGDTFTLLLLIMGTSFCLLNVYLEERLMLEAFGKQYLDYRKRVKRLIPFIY